MATYYKTIVILICLLVVAGCGTLANLEGKSLPAIDAGKQYQPVIFGGVRNDLRWCRDMSVLFILDMPLSILGDIVTIPLVLNHKDDTSPAESHIEANK